MACLPVRPIALTDCFLVPILAVQGYVFLVGYAARFFVVGHRHNYTPASAQPPRPLPCFRNLSERLEVISDVPHSGMNRKKDAVCDAGYRHLGSGAAK